MPNISRQDLNNTTFHLTITLTREELKPQLDAEFKKLRQRAVIKGFRPGQAPVQYVKSLYGTQLFYDKFNDLMSQSLYDYLRDNKLEVLGQPLPVEDQRRQYTFKIDNPEPEYTVTYEVGHVPDFEIQGLSKDQTFERLTISNLDDLAGDDLEYARKRMGQRTTPTDDIQENDILRVAAHEVDGKGKAKADGWSTTITLHVKNVVDEALKADILSKKQGDVIRFKTSQLENMTDEKMVRKYLLNLPEDDTRTVGEDFAGTIEEVSRTGAAELNQDFFDGYFGQGVVSSEGEAIEQVKKGIAQFYDVRSSALLMRHIQERLMELNRFDLPDTFLKRWLSVTNEGLSADTIEREYPAFADNLRWSMTRDRIKEKFGIVVSEEAIRAEFANRIRQYFRADLPDEIIKGGVDRMMRDKKQVEEVEKNVETDLLFAVLREQVTVVDKAVPSEEFHKILDEVTKQAESEQSADSTLQGAVAE